MEAHCFPWAIQCPCRRWYCSKRTVSSYLSASLEVLGGLEGLCFLVCHHSLALHAALWVLAGRAILRLLLVPRDQHSQGYLGFLARHNSNFDRKSVEFPKYRWQFAHFLAQKISIEQEWIVFSFAFRINYRPWLPSGPSYMSRVAETTLPLRQLYRAFKTWCWSELLICRHLLRGVSFFINFILIKTIFGLIKCINCTESPGYTI